MARRIRIAFLSDSLEFGGAEAFLRILSNRLSCEFDIHLVGYDGEVLQSASGGPAVSSHVIGRSFIAARRTLRGLKPDVVLANLTTQSACQLMIAATLSLRIPLVLVDHAPTPGLTWRGRGVQRVITRASAARISVGEAAARRAEQTAGIPRGSVTTIRNGVPARQPCPPPSANPASFPPQQREVVVGALGRLQPVKGLDILLDAFAGVSGAKLRLAGSGPILPALQQQAAALGLSDRVSFDGFCDPEEFLREIDLLALSSRSEALPLTVLEAMQLGKAIVATDVGSLHEVLTDGETALLVPPEDPLALRSALQRLVADPDLRAELGQRAHEKARRELTDETMAAAYAEVFRAAAQPAT